MDIAYLCNGVREFKSTAQYQRIKYLAKNHNLYLFLDKNEKIPDEVIQEVNVYRLDIDTNKNYLGFIRKIWRILSVLSLKKKIDVVYTFYTPRSIVEGAFLKLFGFKWIADVWDHPILPIAHHKRNENLLKKGLYSLSKVVLNKAELVILAIEKETMNDFNLNQRKTLSITNGVDISYYEQVNDRFDTFSIFYVGHIKKERGEILLESAKELEEYGFPFKFHLVGRVQDKENFYDKLEELNLSGKVITYGPIEHSNMIKIMGKSDICVLLFEKTKVTEGIYPIKLFEYLAMGKPTIATKLKGIERIIENEHNGIIVNENKGEDVAEKIVKLYENEDLRKKISKNAKKTAVEYSWSKINEKIGKEIEKIS